MHPNFLSLPPCKRYKRIQCLLHAFGANARILDAPLIILSYGSSSYGFNRKNRGKLDDIDLFLIISQGMSYDEFFRLCEKIFLAKIDYKETHFSELMTGKCDICRMYGHVDNVKIGFRIMTLDTFSAVCSEAGSIRKLCNIASMGQSRILKDKEWSMRLGRYIPIVYDHSYTNVGPEPVLMTMQYAFSSRLARLGPVGRKLLTCSSVYDPDQTGAYHLDCLWQQFVRLSRKWRPNIDPEGIIDSIMRSDRFSPEFRDILRSKIEVILKTL